MNEITAKVVVQPVCPECGHTMFWANWPSPSDIPFAVVCRISGCKLEGKRFRMVPPEVTLTPVEEKDA